MIRYYLANGQDIDRLTNLTYIEKITLIHMMEKDKEEEIEKYNAMFGGGK